MRTLGALLNCISFCLLAPHLALAQAPVATASAPAPETLFQNVRVFDGKSATLSSPTSVLVRGNKIAAIGADAR